MAYNLSTSDGSVLINIPDGQFDTSTSLTLSGPNAVGYGQFLNQNLLSLLNNFASNTAPSGTSQLGQLYYNKGTQILEVFTPQGYVSVAGVTVSFTQPANPKASDRWFNTNTGQFYLFDGTNWELIGPVYTRSQGISGAIPATLNDHSVTNNTHNVLQLQFGNTVIATISGESSSYIPADSNNNLIPGFPIINTGITFNNNLANVVINSNLVGNVFGNVVGSLTGNVLATTVAATTLTGNLVGTHYGAVTGTFSGNASGNFTGVVTATQANIATANITNLSSSSVQISSGNVTGLTNLSTANGTITTLSTSGITATSGQITGLSNINATAGTVTTLNSTNLQTSTATAQTANITTLTVGNVSATTSVTTNFSTGNAQITGGNVSAFSLSSTNSQVSGNLTVSSVFSTNTVGVSTSLINLYVNNTSANVIRAATIGNTGATLTGTLTSASQTNITGVGTITTGAWQANVVAPAYGGTGINNGLNTLTLASSYTLNQPLSIGAGPSFVGTYFTGYAPNLSVTNANVAVVANTLNTGSGFTVTQSGNKLMFKYNGNAVCSVDSAGNAIFAGNVTGFATP
jgi:hypothetical protein